jgi:hypothetical protein
MLAGLFFRPLEQSIMANIILGVWAFVALAAIGFIRGATMRTIRDIRQIRGESHYR